MKLSASEAKQRLFPNAPQGRRPSPDDKPLDTRTGPGKALIEALPHERARQGNEFYQVLIGILDAVEIASAAASKEDDIRSQDKALNDLENSYKKTADEMVAALAAIRLSPDLSVFDRALDQPAWRAHRELQERRLSAAEDAVRDIGARLADLRNRLAKRRSSQDAVGFSFVDNLVPLWWLMTGPGDEKTGRKMGGGRYPTSPDEQFLEFVQAAYKAVGGKRKTSWVHQIRVVMDSRATRLLLPQPGAKADVKHRAPRHEAQRKPRQSK